MALEGRSDDAAALLGGLPSGSARERCRREVDLALVLAFGLNRSRDGAERLELLLDDVDDDQWGYVAGQIPLMWLLAGEIHEARRAAEDVLADARSSGADRLSAELVLIPALNLLGLPVSALDRATGVLPRVADHPAFNEYMVGQLETAVPTGPPLRRRPRHGGAGRAADVRAGDAAGGGPPARRLRPPAGPDRPLARRWRGPSSGSWRPWRPWRATP